MFQYVVIVALLNLAVGCGIAAFLGRRYGLYLALGGTPIAIPTRTVRAKPKPAARAAKAKQASPDDAPPSRPPSVTTKALRSIGTEVQRYQEELAKADGALRDLVQDPQPDTVEQCLRKLTAATEGYVLQRDQAYRGLQELAEGQPGGNAIYSMLDDAMARQTRQIEAVGAAVLALGSTEDRKRGCRLVMDQTGKLLDANQHLRDTLTRTIVNGIQRSPESADPEFERDPLTGTLNRVALENALAEWQRNDPNHGRRLAAALIDLDHFGRVNTDHGHQVGDRVLQAVARILMEESGDNTKVARLCGHAFVLLRPDVEGKSDVRSIEKLRQTIEHVRFTYRGEEVRLTASCAITDLASDDTSERFLSRLNSTLMEAKRYGRNRTFIHDGEYPTPVTPPALTLSERDIPL